MSETATTSKLINKKINTRIQLKCDLEKNWKAATNFIPKSGELIIYSAETAQDQLPTDRTTLISYPRFKVGDGKTTVNNLPFVTYETGNSLRPIYIKSDGSFATTTYSLEASVPADAKFTDTKIYTAKSSGLASNGNISFTVTDWNKKLEAGQILLWQTSVLPSSNNVNLYHNCNAVSSIDRNYALTVHGKYVTKDFLSTSAYYLLKVGDGNALTILADSSSASTIKSHVADSNIHVTASEKSQWNTHVASEHAPANAQPNQNAFSNVKVGSTTISANNTTATLELEAGSNITLTPNTTSGKVTIKATNTVYTHPTYGQVAEGLYKVTVNGTGHVSKATKVTKSDITALGIPSKDTVYTHPTGSGSNHIPAGGESGQILRWSADGTAVWGADKDTTYSPAGDSLGLVKTGGDVTISEGIITVKDDSHNHVISNIDGLQNALDGKAPASHIHPYAPEDHNHDEEYEPLGAVAALKEELLGEGAAEALDTIGEISDALRDNADIIGVLENSISGKADANHTHSYAAPDHNHDGEYAPITHSSASAMYGVGTADNYGHVKLFSSTNTIDYNSNSGAITPAVLKAFAAPASHTHNYAGSSSAGGPATSANKLATSRTIELGTAVTSTATSFNGTSNITIPINNLKESYLIWGGKSYSGEISPLGTALSAEHSANRIAYLNPAAISVETSNDGGTNWSDYEVSDENKTKLVTTTAAINIGSTTPMSTNHRTRITLTAQDGTTTFVYTRPRKLLINMSSFAHELSVTLEAKKGTSGATWQDLGTYPVSGWSGWNEIPVPNSMTTFGGSPSQTGNYWYFRLTFNITKVNSSYTNAYATVQGLRLFGENSWVTTSNMGATGHLYAYDHLQNATFPAQVTATLFRGNLTGTADRAKAFDTSITKGSLRKGIKIESGNLGETVKIPQIFYGETMPSNSVGEDGDLYVMPVRGGAETPNRIPRIYSGTAEPDASIGMNGDVYILYQ